MSDSGYFAARFASLYPTAPMKGIRYGKLRMVLDIGIFLARHMVVAFLLLFLLGVAIERLTGRSNAWRRLSPTFGRRALVGTSVFLLVGFVAISAWYVFNGGFSDDVEPVVSSLSWQVQSGQVLYTSFEQAERYSVLYGPSVFLTNGWFLKILGPSLPAAKMASALAAIGSLLFLYASLARGRKDWVALTVTAGSVLFYWTQGVAIYLVRPDALLVFSVSLGLYVAARGSRWLAIVTVAVLAGFTFNLKIHCLLYYLPVIVVLAQRFGLKDSGWALLGGLAVAIAPFAFYSQISVLNYLKWLANEASHGFSFGLLVEPVRYLIFLVLPIGVLAFLRGPRKGYLGRNSLVVMSMLPAGLFALLLSAKPGSGIVHLLPLVPSAMFATGRLLQSLVENGCPTWGRLGSRPAAVALVFTVLVAGSVNEYRVVRLIDSQLDQIPGIVEDVEAIMDRHEGLTMAMALGGENGFYRYTWFKPLLAFRNNPVLLDPISVMDTVKSKKPLAEATYNAISEGQVALWLVPRAQVPFQKMSWYDPDVPIFPGDFIQLFQDCYRLGEQSRYFDLWFWKGLDAIPAASASTGDPQSAGSLAP